MIKISCYARLKSVFRLSRQLNTARERHVDDTETTRKHEGDDSHMQEQGEPDLAARTMLEQRIRQRRQTFEEFAEYAETFAREHGEPGTLSVRHLQRLVAGRRPDGRPLGPVRPATARLLERIFGLTIGELLAAPQSASAHPLRVAIGIVVADSKVLLVCRRGEETSGISWQFPAGLVKPGTSPRSVAVHETFAETGIHCVAACDLGSRLHPTTRVMCDYVLCDYVTGAAKNLDVR